MFSLGAPAKLAPAAWVIYYVLLVGAAAVAVHVMAVVWKLDEMSRKNEMKNQCENDVPCMS